MRSLRPVLVALVAATVACGGGGADATDSARAATDTTFASTALQPAGPLGAVPAADAGDAMDATAFELTDANLQRFVRASEALSFLRARDANIRGLLERTGGDTVNASLREQLEQHPQVSKAIADAGMSVKDYYVMAIALQNAQHHAANPAGAPATPVGRKNAEFVQRNQGALARLQTWGSAVAR